MDSQTKSIVAGVVSFALDLWATHAGKPKDWKPSTNDYLELLDEIESATPEHEEEEARKRLGL